MYGLKEKAIAKLLIQVLNISKDSEDAKNMLNWKLPGHSFGSSVGDFAGRCFEALKKRSAAQTYGEMTIAQVNAHLDQLSSMSKEEDQLPLFRRFFRRMNAEELTWLIRIVLRQMRIGATERTILDIWHPDAESLFNVSSSLRRVCWELHDRRVRLDGGSSGVTLMQCFQPQLAAFQSQMHSFERMVARMRPTEEDNAFWIEEKLDGERMQLHMVEDAGCPSGKRFGFWSRKAKDYAYLYGTNFDESNALVRHIRDAFHPNVRNIVLDGEMITWDTETDHIVPFGTLKTAALAEKEAQSGRDTGQRPLFRVFDCLYLNDTLLTPYTLRDRRSALHKVVCDVPRRLETHTYHEARSPAEIEPRLRHVIVEASEGLVLKNPRSTYRLNERNDDWIKVKPEYMDEFGESLDCVVIGGVFGSGRRGGFHSSYLCGLLVDKDALPGSPKYEKCYSLFRVGGGFTRDDYATVRRLTEGKWKDYDPQRPPSVIELGTQPERPDQWIRPSDSVVISVKAASVEPSEKYRMGITLRFPRFKQLRTDKRWQDALSIPEFMELKDNAMSQHRAKEEELKIEQNRHKKARTKTKKPLKVVGAPEAQATYAGPASAIFAKLKFCQSASNTCLELERALTVIDIMTDANIPERKTKAELESMVKAHGGAIVQQESTADNLVVIADKRTLLSDFCFRSNERQRSCESGFAHPSKLTQNCALNLAL